MKNKLRGKNILICGIGGQGIVFASNLLSNYFLERGFDIKVSDIMGLGQRGGSVITHFRYGEKVLSPLIKRGSADIIIAFEKIEALRWIHYLKEDGILFCNNYQETPTTVTSGLQRNINTAKYFEEIKGRVDIKLLNGYSVIKRNNLNKRVLNMIMLGYISKFLKWDIEIMKSILSKKFKEEYLKINMLAYNLGINLCFPKEEK